MMNGLSIVVGLIFIVFAIVGYCRGFIKIVASLAATIASIMLVAFLTPYASSMLLKALPLEKIVQEKCAEIFIPEAQGEEVEGDSVSDTPGILVQADELRNSASEASEILTQADDSRETQISLIENAKLPEVFRQLLLENNNDEIYKSLGVTKFSEYVGSYLAKLIANIAGFLLILIVVTIIVRLVLYTLGIIEKLPMIGGLNRVAGGIVGLGTGLVMVWVLFIVITLMYDTEIGRTCFAHITENEFLTQLYNSNILMNFITKFRG